MTTVAQDTDHDWENALAEALSQLARQRPGRQAGNSIVHVVSIDTPLGEMIAGSTADHLVLLEFVDRQALVAQLRRLTTWLRCEFVPGEIPVLAALRQQLDEYFRGARVDFDLPLEPRGTDFQMQVWGALRTIPSGSTRSYADIARIIGRPTAVRAVASANGDNRISILIPCHRVIGSDGKLVGYGGGIWRKERLLAIETRAALAPME